MISQVCLAFAVHVANRGTLRRFLGLACSYQFQKCDNYSCGGIQDTLFGGREQNPPFVTLESGFGHKFQPYGCGALETCDGSWRMTLTLCPAMMSSVYLWSKKMSSIYWNSLSILCGYAFWKGRTCSIRLTSLWTT